MLLRSRFAPVAAALPVHGKEGVDGSSPSEGLKERQPRLVHDGETFRDGEHRILGFVCNRRLDKSACLVQDAAHVRAAFREA
jgi:hypothetical protein